MVVLKETDVGNYEVCYDGWPQSRLYHGVLQVTLMI